MRDVEPLGRFDLLTRLLPALLLCACTTAAPLITGERSDLQQAVTPYARGLREAGITRVLAGSGPLIRLDTLSGPVYIGYPPGLSHPEFTLEIDAANVRASASSFDRQRDSPALEAILAESIRRASSNNVQQWIRANPWH